MGINSDYRLLKKDSKTMLSNSSAYLRIATSNPNHVSKKVYDKFPYPSLGRIVKTYQEINNDITMSYDVELIDGSGTYIENCKCLNMGAGFNGKGQYITYEIDDPVLIININGVRGEGNTFIIGGFNTIGDYDRFYNRGLLQADNELDTDEDELSQQEAEEENKSSNSQTKSPTTEDDTTVTSPTPTTEVSTTPSTLDVLLDTLLSPDDDQLLPPPPTPTTPPSGNPNPNAPTTPQQPIRYNQPFVHPNKIVHPGSWISAMNSKSLNAPYISIENLTEEERDINRGVPGIIQVSTPEGIKAEYSHEGLIQYTDGNVMVMAGGGRESKALKMLRYALKYAAKATGQSKFESVSVEAEEKEVGKQVATEPISPNDKDKPTTTTTQPNTPTNTQPTVTTTPIVNSFAAPQTNSLTQSRASLTGLLDNFIQDTKEAIEAIEEVANKVGEAFLPFNKDEKKKDDEKEKQRKNNIPLDKNKGGVTSEYMSNENLKISQEYLKAHYLFSQSELGRMAEVDRLKTSFGTAMGIAGGFPLVGNGKTYQIETPNSQKRLEGDTNKPMIVWHETVSSVQDAVSWIKNPSSKVSYHAIVARDGSVYLLAPPDHQAYGSGVSSFFSKEFRTSVNNFSYQISFESPVKEELEKLKPLMTEANKTKRGGFYLQVPLFGQPVNGFFTDAQYTAAATLAARVGIEPDRWATHAEVAWEKPFRRCVQPAAGVTINTSECREDPRYLDFDKLKTMYNQVKQTVTKDISLGYIDNNK